MCVDHNVHYSIAYREFVVCEYNDAVARYHGIRVRLNTKSQMTIRYVYIIQDWKRTVAAAFEDTNHTIFRSTRKWLFLAHLSILIVMDYLPIKVICSTAVQSISESIVPVQTE